MRIAENAPDKLLPRNRGVLRMRRSSLHDFAATKDKGLPMRAAKGKARLIGG